ncbi:hypothetical protein P9139_19740 [Curtobacterium flaccumfaciens]|nr:hypothetical protein P9139_19740 [Curtobacterium flaccumfaciens]
MSVPAVGVVMPSRARIVVVFPEPLLPRSPKVSPGAMSNDRPSTTFRSPKRITKSRTPMLAPLMLATLPATPDARSFP